MYHESLNRLAAVLVLAAASACTDAAAPKATPTTEFITQMRPWRAGERQALVARVQRDSDFVLPFLGNVSPWIDQFLPVDSVTDIVPNPDWPVASADVAFSPAFSVRHAEVPGTGWTTMGLRIREVNSQQGGDSLILHGVLWFNNTDSTWKGFLFAANPATTFAATTVNTTAFDASFGKSGVGGGEARASDGTTWLANGTGSPNTFAISFYLPFGSAKTITTGPFLGGTSRQTILSDNVNNVGLTRILGSGTPVTQTASVSGFLGGTEIVCIFPSPCTTNQ